MGVNDHRKREEWNLKGTRRSRLGSGTGLRGIKRKERQGRGGFDDEGIEEDKEDQWDESKWHA